MIVEFDVDADKFIEELRETKNRFYTMVDTMKSIALLIELNTTEYVPLDTSALEQSYEYHIMPSGDYILMMVGYDAEDEDNGYHYAEIQHENEEFNHPRRGTAHYLVKGITDSKGEMFKLIEKDYLSLFFGGGVTSSATGTFTGGLSTVPRRLI